MRLFYNKNVEFAVPPLPSPARKIKYIPVDRKQLCYTNVDIDQLIGQDHVARAILAMVERTDLELFEEKVATLQGEAGAPCWPAKILVSLLIYGYSLGLTSARILEQMQNQEPGMRWLCANEIINYRTITGFRVKHGKALENLFVQVLAVLSEEGLVDLSTVMQDGTKMQAVAGKESYHRRGTLEKHLELARAAVQQLEAKSEEEQQRGSKRREAAQQRAARERLGRLEQALEKVKELQEGAAPAEREKMRVSESEAEARKKKMPDGAWVLGYNVQMVTEASNKVIVGVGLSTAANDLHELQMGLQLVESNCGRAPATMVADNGYATRENVECMSQAGVEFIAPWKEDESREAGGCKTNGIDPEFASSKFVAHPEYEAGEGLLCKAGKALVRIGERKHHGVVRRIFQAQSGACESCSWRQACCGKSGGPRRVEQVQESAAMQQYLKRMSEPTVQERYKKRKEVAEFPHLWIKGILGIRRFRVRGPTKARLESLWMALSYNVTQWIRLRWAGQVCAANAA